MECNGLEISELEPVRTCKYGVSTHIECCTTSKYFQIYDKYQIKTFDVDNYQCYFCFTEFNKSKYQKTTIKFNDPTKRYTHPESRSVVRIDYHRSGWKCVKILEHFEDDELDPNLVTFKRR